MRPARAPGIAALLTCAALAPGLISGCGEDDDPPPVIDAIAPAPQGDPADGGADDRFGSTQAPRRAKCPADLTGCRSAIGEILYVERVDPDGDGDAHFVITGDDSITAPGISVLDVAVDLRPHPLPRPGEWISAAGQVRQGSYGQNQIEAVVVEVGPPTYRSQVRTMALAKPMP